MSGSKMRWIAGAVSAAALVMGSVAPAAARGPGGWGSGGWSQSNWGSRGWGGYRHRDRGLNGGEIIGIAALIGAVAVIASSASKNGKSRSSYPDDRDYRDSRDYPDDDAYVPSGAAMSADQAADACALAVRDKVEGEQGGYAQILDITEPRAAGQDGWAVDGRVERRSGYRGGGGEVRRFSCDVQGSRVAEVYISRDAG